MKLQTTNKEGKQLEFNEDMEIDQLDLYHNEFFLDLLLTIDKLVDIIDN